MHRLDACREDVGEDPEFAKRSDSRKRVMAAPFDPDRGTSRENQELTAERDDVLLGRTACSLRAKRLPPLVRGLLSLREWGESGSVVGYSVGTAGADGSKFCFISQDHSLGIEMWKTASCRRPSSTHLSGCGRSVTAQRESKRISLSTKCPRCEVATGRDMGRETHFARLI